MNSLSHRIVIRTRLAKCLFILLTLLFVSNALFPEIHKYSGTELVELQDLEDAESDDQKEENEEVDDEFFHFHAWSQIGSYDILSPKLSGIDINSSLSSDICTPPPEQV